MKTRFIKTTDGARLAENMGFSVRKGRRTHFCGCGCGNVLFIEKGWVFNTGLSCRALRKAGIITSSTIANGIY